MRALNPLLSLILSLTVINSARAALPPSSPLAASDERNSFQFADPDLAIHLVAAEPDVSSPVSIAWDADGRLFVAEMIDYPSGPVGGQIRLLEDIDGDGRYEKATVFADGLPFPNCVLPWNGGVLVTAAPNLWFFKDTNGDGRSDERRVLFTGFAEGNQQLRANGLYWGLDNWIYGANGRSDGDVRRADGASGFFPGPSGDGSRPVSIRRRDFRFHPRTGEFQAIAGYSQFGLAHDDWGNRFSSWNTIPARHIVIEERYLSRDPYLSGAESMFDTLPPGDDGRVFPLTPPPLVFNNESSSHFNALAGLTIFRGDALGEKYRGNAFMGESLRNLVHRRLLFTNGVTFAGKRGEQGKEFLASTDPWFHPVNFATGPDGALYVVDFYRQFVEHPGWVPEAVRSKPPWRQGANHGRIWRITAPKVASAPKRNVRPQLSRADTAELVKQLENENGWWRDTAQRLLVERQDHAAVRPLKALLRRKSALPTARLHSFWTLEGLGELDVTTFYASLDDVHAAIRSAAVRLSDSFCGTELRKSNTSYAKTGLPLAEQKLASLVDDPDPRVRLQLALVLGDLGLPKTTTLLSRLAASGVNDRWQSLAVLSSLGDQCMAFVQTVLRDQPSWRGNPSKEQITFLSEMARLVGARNRIEDNLSMVTLLRAVNATAGNLALLGGFADGLRQRGQSLIAVAKEVPGSSGDNGAWLGGMFIEAARVAIADAQPDHARLAAVRLFGHAPSPTGAKPLLELLARPVSSELQNATIRAFTDLNDVELAESVFSNWTRYTPATRRQIASGATRSEAFRAELCRALESGAVQAIELEAGTRQRLLQIKEGPLAERFAKLLKAIVTPDREGLLRFYESALSLEGKGERGGVLFAKACLLCHVVQGEGGKVGPDLSGIGSRPKEALLVDIVDPSRQVAPDFVSYTVRTKKGETWNGLLTAETATSVTLRRAGEPDDIISRDDIAELKADGKSLMPEGLEQGMSPQDVADLLSFLRQPQKALLK